MTIKRQIVLYFLPWFFFCLFFCIEINYNIKQIKILQNRYITIKTDKNPKN